MENLKTVPSATLKSLGRSLFPRPMPEDALRTTYDIKDLENLVKVSQKFHFNYLGKNVAFSFKPIGIGLNILTNYETARKELSDAVDVMSPKFSGASRLLGYLEMASPKEGDVTDPRVFGYNLQTRLPGLSSLFAPEDERKAIVEEEKSKLASQLISYFKNHNKREGIILKSSTFSKFADEVRGSYGGTAYEAEDIAYR